MATTTPAPSGMSIPTPAPKITPPAKKPKSSKMSRKCSLGKPNCGLLHDNMSLMWGKFKDAVDSLQAKMDKDAQAFKDLIKDLNTQMSVLMTAKGTLITQLAEATANKNVDVEEQGSKEEEEGLLQAQFKEVWGECKATIYEILFTNICGVLTVRGEVAKFSKEVTPNDIVDCEVSDFTASMCTVPCDDKCINPTVPCGGTQLLDRVVIQMGNENGIKCPQLQYKRVCSQFKC